MQSDENRSADPAGAAAPAGVSPADLAACCLLKLNRPAEAEALLTQQGDCHDRGCAEYYLGVALAHQGKIGEAIGRLQQACEAPTNGKAAREALLALLKRQVQQRMACRNWDAAGAALTQALAIDSSDAELQQMLLVLGNYLPVNYLKANRRPAAADVWEKAQKKDPADMRIAHSLGLLYFWSAQELETQGKGTEAAAAWQGAIRNWVALAYGGSFWAHLQEARGQVYGDIPEPAVDGIRHKLTGQLGRRIADYQNDYLAQKRTADTQRMSRLSLELAAELRTAEALQRVARSLQRQGKTARVPPLCGVLMLKHVGQLETAKQLLALVEITQTNEASTEQLHWCLSPWVFPWIMVQERRYQEAVEHLERELRGNAAAEDGHDLLAQAYLERGKLLAAAGEVQQALDAWKTGLGHVRARKRNAEGIKREAENAAIKEATRLSGEGSVADYNLAVQVLEKARTITDSTRLKQNESGICVRLGVVTGNDESAPKMARWETASKHHERALQLYPENAEAKSNLAIVLTNLGNEQINVYRNFAKGREFMERALTYDQTSSYTRESLAGVLCYLGIDSYNRGIAANRGTGDGGRWSPGANLKIEGVQLVARALTLDPTNQHARTQLLGMIGQDAWLAGYVTL